VPEIAKNRRLIILGAGCSYAAGLPDGDRLATHLLGYVGGAPWEIVYNKFPSEHWAPLYHFLLNVLAELAEGGPQSRWKLDRIFDRFYQLLRLDPTGFRTVYGLLFEAAAQLLYARSCYGGTTDVYQNFVKALEMRDVILTFNWDICTEIALNRANRPFSRTLRKAPKKLPWLLKLHGSIDYLIVDVSRRRKDRKGRAEFLETLDAEAPSPFPGRRFELTRLRTYDLGYKVVLEQVAERDSETMKLQGVAGGYDVGPFLLTYKLEEYPSYHMLTPGSAKLLYDWQYQLVTQLLETVCPEVGEIIVAGYSFQAYDKPVHKVLRTVHRAADKPPVHIVNPSAASIKPNLLKSIFGKCELHACGFGEYEW